MSKELVDGNFIDRSARKIQIGDLVGPPGDSAYQIAVNHGYVGTEVEWIASLQASGILDPVTNLPSDEVVAALNTALIAPYEVDQLTAYTLGKI